MPRRRPPGRWVSLTTVDVPHQDWIQRVLMKGGVVRRIHPGTFQLVNGIDAQFTEDEGDRATVRQYRLLNRPGFSGGSGP